MKLPSSEHIRPVVAVAVTAGSIVAIVLAFVGTAAVPVLILHGTTEPLEFRMVFAGVGACGSASLLWVCFQSYAWGLKQMFRSRKRPTVVPMTVQVGPKGTVF